MAAAVCGRMELFFQPISLSGAAQLFREECIIFQVVRPFHALWEEQSSEDIRRDKKRSQQGISGFQPAPPVRPFFLHPGYALRFHHLTDAGLTLLQFIMIPHSFSISAKPLRSARRKP